MMNNINLIGRLTKTPELRYTTNDKAVCEFTLACNRLNEGTDFITCVCWNKQAENLCKYQTKGGLIAVSGRLTVDTFDDNNGNKRYKTYVLVNNLEYLSSKGKSEKIEETKISTNPFAEFREEIEFNEDNLPF